MRKNTSNFAIFDVLPPPFCQQPKRNERL